jgi:predicted dehydrogenase
MLGAGKAVLCEKAFTMSAGEAEDLIELAHANQVFLMEAMWMRANPAIRKAVELIADGAIGEVLSVRADISLPQEPAPEHRLRDPKLGGGALLDLGVYAVSLAQLVLGDLELVGASGTMFPEGSDRRTAMLLRAETGAVAQLACALHADYPTDATISGTAGRIEIPGRFYRPNGFTLHRDGEVERFDLPYTGNGLHYQAIEAMDCLRAGAIESSLIPLSSTLSVMRTLDDIATYIGLRYP